MITSDTQIGNEFWHNLSLEKRLSEKVLIWDSTQPMFVYREEPILSLTELMCFIGGLFSLWFGTNGKDFIVWIIERRLWLWIYNKIYSFKRKNV